MKDIDQINAEQREKARKLLGAGCKVREIANFLNMGLSTVYAVRDKMRDEQGLTKPVAQNNSTNITDEQIRRWDYIHSRYGIPKKLWDEWDKLNRIYGKANTYR